MIQRQAFKEQIHKLIPLAIPILLAQVAVQSMGFVDTIVAGRAGAVEMSGVAVGASFWIPITLFAQGFISAIMPIIAQSIGANNPQSVGKVFRQGLWISVFMSIVIIVVFLFISDMMLQRQNVNPEINRVTSGYLKAILFGTPGLLLYCTCRSFLDGSGRTRPAMITGFLALFFNIPLNFIFAFGYFGMPALGGIGCAVASAIVFWIMGFTMLYFAYRHDPRVFFMEKMNLALQARIMRIGFPGACALLIETSTFAIIAFLIAPLSEVVVAGHQIAMNATSMVFTIPLSLGFATTILVGNYVGAGDMKRAKDARITATIAAIFIACATSALLIFFRFHIAEIYVDSALSAVNFAAVQLAGQLMFFAGVFQLFDTVQIVQVCTLRGYNDTKMILIISLLGFWGLALPLGYVLCFTSIFGAPMGVHGFWIGLLVGLFIVAVLFAKRAASLEKMTIEEVLEKINR